MSTHFIRFQILLWLTLAIVSQPLPARAASQITSDTPVYTFGDSVTFTANIQIEEPVKEAMISIQSQGDPETLVKPVVWNPNGEITYTYKESEHPLRAFAKVYYWFNLILENGENLSSPKFAFDYVDNRFTWRTLDGGSIKIHWYEGDQAFAQNILDVAHEGLERIQTILPVQSPSGSQNDKIDYYIYANMTDMQAALPINSQKWVAGHADPDLNVAKVSLPAGPEQLLWTEQRVPHELMHILMFHYKTNGYSNIPTWLREGMASIAELTPDPDYQVILETAVAKKTLISLTSLCQSFPIDQSGAAIAYAEATYFTRYLYHQYGSSGLQALITGYADGLDCQRGTEMALGIPLTQLEEKWRNEIFGPAADAKNASEMLPWFGLLLVVLLVPLLMAFAGMRLNRRPKVSAEETGVYVVEV